MTLARIAIISLLFHSSNAFTTIPSKPLTFGRSNGLTWNSLPSSKPILTSLSATGAGKKKRRRRKDPSSTVDAPLSTGEKTVAEDLGLDDELPEFDLQPEEDDDSDSSSSSASSEKVVTLGELSLDGMNDPGLMDIMKGDGASFGSAKDLLRSRDRTIEQSFQFEKVAEPLPKIGAMVTDDAAPKVGRKKAKTQERRSLAAIREAEREKEEGGFFSSLPFIGKKNDGEEVSVIKSLENATWVAIGILFLWEVYLNSPLFQRAAEMAPVVYENRG